MKKSRFYLVIAATVVKCTYSLSSTKLPAYCRQRVERVSFPSSYFTLKLSSDGGISSDRNDETPKKLDSMLSTGTNAFPLFVLGSAILGVCRPISLQWVNNGSLISLMLAGVMCGTGLTLTKQDFIAIRENSSIVPLGVSCQFGIMPFAAFCVGQVLLRFSFLPTETSQALFLGLVLVGCSPGGTASNLVSLIARADVALSVVLTTCSTLLAVVLTPLLVKLLVGNSSIAISGITLVKATAQVVLAPVLLGMAIKSKFPNLAMQTSRFTPFLSVVLVSLICGGVVAQNASLLQQSGGGITLPIIGGAVLLLHSIGFAAGYLIPSKIMGRNSKNHKDSAKTARTISIETGMQNSALSVVLARSIGAPLLATLPGALSATAHSCLGSILAAFWRWKDSKERPKDMMI